MNVNHFELRSDNAIVIKNIELFSSEILPKYFKHTSFKSFEKQVSLLLSSLRLSLRVQLYLYDFHRLPPVDSDTQMVFGHECFKRGRPDLLTNVSLR